MAEPSIDPRTKRPLGDHGKAHQAIEFALENIEDHHDFRLFLDDWMHGGAFENWPEFYPWLAEKERSDAP